MSALIPAQVSTNHDHGDSQMMSLPGAEGQGNLPPFNVITKQILRRLEQQINAPPPACPGLQEHETLGPERLTDVRTRFLLWSGNLGVMRKPEDPRALDMRLLSAPEVASRVRDILQGLQDLLSQCGEPCDCNATNGITAQGVHSMDEEDAMMMQLLGLQTSKSCTSSWLSASVDDTLRRLFHLSALISKSSTRDKFARAEMKCRLEMYEAYDVRHVHEKVAYAGGRADIALVKRLGKANTSRRQFITYSRKHAAELNHTAQLNGGSPNKELVKLEHDDALRKNPYDQSVTQSEKTKKSAAPTKASTLGPINPNEFDYGLDDARSCTTVATSIVDGKALSGLKVPKLAQYAKPGVHFVCPLCQTCQRFNGQTAWRRHVFFDIRAYVCTSTSCGMLMFGSFNAWRSHEMDHRREWFCPLCSVLHHDKLKARMHLIRDHAELARDHHGIDLLLQASSRPSLYLPADDCPFCEWGVTLRKRNRTPKEDDLKVPSRRFMKHLGRHLEEIALFVIPEPEEELRSSGDTASNAVHAVLDGENSTASTLSSFESQPAIGASVTFEQSEGFEGPPPDEAHRGDTKHMSIRQTIFPDFAIKDSTFFSVGRVFEVLWAEAVDSATKEVLPVPNQFGERVFSKVRRFVVVRESEFSKVRRFVVVREGGNSCTAVPISTYNGYGVASPRVVKSDHAIIYTGGLAPTPREKEHSGPGEGPMKSITIRVNPDDTTKDLDPMSRINFGGATLIQHNVMVKSFGSIHMDSVQALQMAAELRPQSFVGTAGRDVIFSNI